MRVRSQSSRAVLCAFLVAAASCGGTSTTTTESTGSTNPPSSGSTETPASAATPGSTAMPTEGSAAMPAQGSTATPAEGSTATPAQGSTEPPAITLPAMPTNLRTPPRPWARMSDRDRGRYMNEAVLPVMRELLRGYDATEFANVTCATCHGANAQQVRFHMPNTLPRIPMFGTPELTAWMQRDPRMFAFMRERMVPVMAQLLGQQPYNPQTHQGFGCGGCHSMGAAPAAATR